jgi:DNA polymerase-3 subunit delta
MVAAKAGDVAGLLRRPDRRVAVFLFFGPDTGLINERARLVAEASVDDPADPFQLIRIDGDVIASEPGRLLDEVATVGLFGNRRAVWVKATSRNLAPAVEAVLESANADTAVVIEGGDLAKSAPLRVLCERSQKALAVPCYVDSARDLGEIVDETLKVAGLAIDRDARAALIASLGGDRLASRGELAKLVLYAHGQKQVTADDVEAILSDVSSLAIDAVIDAAFAGDLGVLETGWRRLAAEGIAASTLLGAALRHALSLLSVRLEVETGRSIESAAESWRGLHFRRKPAVQKQLQRWSAASLGPAIRAIHASVLETRKLADLDDAIAAKLLLDLARAARR